MEKLIENEIEVLSTIEVVAAAEAASEVLRQYAENPDVSGNLVMMAFN